MSEYQYIYFRAIDEPLSDKSLKYMRTQSTRAQITRRSFENEYNFGDFHGNFSEMMRRGYDFHFYYANFGVRNLYFRLPQGFPEDKEARAYLDDESFTFETEKGGPAGILSIMPFLEPGTLDEIWNLKSKAIRLSRLRAEIIRGDLRPLFLARLAICIDDQHAAEEETVPSVPEGLDNLSPAQVTLARFYGISRALVTAVAQTAKRSRKGAPQASIAELQAEAKVISDEIRDKKAVAAARRRSKTLAKMAEQPEPYLKKADRLVSERTGDAYEEASTLLADLREALASTDRAQLPATHARILHEQHPTLNHLTAALRRKGFIPKVPNKPRR